MNFFETLRAAWSWSWDLRHEYIFWFVRVLLLQSGDNLKLTQCGFTPDIVSLLLLIDGLVKACEKPFFKLRQLMIRRSEFLKYTIEFSECKNCDRRISWVNLFCEVVHLIPVNFRILFLLLLRNQIVRSKLQQHLLRARYKHFAEVLAVPDRFEQFYHV